MWSGFSLISANVGMSLENIVLILLMLGSMIFMAKDFKIGVVILFVTSGMSFVLFYLLSMNYVPFLVVFFMTLVILAITLLMVNRTVSRGAFI